MAWILVTPDQAPRARQRRAFEALRISDLATGLTVWTLQTIKHLPAAAATQRRSSSTCCRYRSLLFIRPDGHRLEALAPGSALCRPSSCSRDVGRRAHRADPHLLPPTQGLTSAGRLTLPARRGASRRSSPSRPPPTPRARPGHRNVGRRRGALCAGPRHLRAPRSPGWVPPGTCPPRSPGAVPGGVAVIAALALAGGLLPLLLVRRGPGLRAESPVPPTGRRCRSRDRRPAPLLRRPRPDEGRGPERARPRPSPDLRLESWSTTAYPDHTIEQWLGSIDRTRAWSTTATRPTARSTRPSRRCSPWPRPTTSCSWGATTSSSPTTSRAPSRPPSRRTRRGRRLPGHDGHRRRRPADRAPRRPRQALPAPPRPERRDGALGKDALVSLLRGNWTYFPSLCWRRDLVGLDRLPSRVRRRPGPRPAGRRARRRAVSWCVIPDRVFRYRRHAGERVRADRPS